MRRERPAADSAEGARLIPRARPRPPRTTTCPGTPTYNTSAVLLGLEGPIGGRSGEYLRRLGGQVLGIPIQKRLTHADVGGHEHRAGTLTVGQEG